VKKYQKKQVVFNGLENAIGVLGEKERRLGEKKEFGQ